MFSFLIFTIVGALGWAVSQPIIPSYAPRYQLVYLTPPYRINQYQPERISQPILHNRVVSSDSVEDSVESSVEEEKFEVSQFHSEDADGRIVFGFHSPDQIRMETRDADGSVRGSYSYIDPNGNIVKMQYWDDGSGFHAAGNNLPVAIHQTPEYTPEVKAAREHHLRLYDAALAALKAAAVNEESDKDESGFIDTSNYEGDEYEEQDVPPEGGVIIENPAPPSSVYADSLLTFENPKVQLSQTNQLSDNSHFSDEDKESVSIENPEFRRKLWLRKGKSEINQNVNDGTKLEENQQPDSTRIPAAVRMDVIPPNVMSSKDAAENRAFFYHYTHTIPRPVERVDNSEESKMIAQPSYSVRAQQLGSIPVDAVHDAQVSPLQRNIVPNFQLFPVYQPERN